MKNISILLIIWLILASCGNTDKTTDKANAMYEISTSFGAIKIRLFDEAIQHKNNFEKLVKNGFYDSLLFHRVISGFMIQGGSPDSKNAPEGTLLGMDEKGDIGYLIQNEFSEAIPHKRGVLAAARDNNPELASSGCQFYIVQGQVYNDGLLDNIELKYNAKLPLGHRDIYKTIGGAPHLFLLKFTVFGEVVDGLDVIDKIATVATDESNRPLKNIIMTIKKIK